MIISALAGSSRVLHEPRYLEAAQQDALMIETHLDSSGTGRLKRCYSLGTAEGDGFLSDYEHDPVFYSTFTSGPSICGG